MSCQTEVSHDVVAFIQLYLTGTLSSWLSNLSSLEIISLDHQMFDMKLSGKIDIFASFKHLRLLWLQSNSWLTYGFEQLVVGGT
jgi:hypothetical protein